MEPFNSAMLAWNGTLSEEEIWQVISYVRTFSEGQPEIQQDTQLPQEEDTEDEHHQDDTDHHAGGGEHHEEESDHHE